MREYESYFALSIRGFIVYRKASGRRNETSHGPNLRVFDRFYAMNYPDSVHLTQEMVGRWCRQRDSGTNNPCGSRIYVVYSPIKYLSERRLSEVLSPRIPRKKRVTYIPYAFSGDEIRSSFKVCDSLPGVLKVRNMLTRHITVPVLLRLLYSSGIRTTEARLLECADVDVGDGILNIRHSRGRDQHYIALHDSIVGLMHHYDGAIREWFPSRKYSLPIPGDVAHPHTWAEKNFRRVWVEVSNDRTATAYAFRHHYTTANINRWIGDRFAFDGKLICLSKSTGYTTLESIRYYYSVVSDLPDIVLKKIEDGFNELMPEVIS